MTKLDLITDVMMFIAAVAGLLSSLFNYFEIPKKGQFFVAVFFLSSLLSDYYWTTYSLVMHVEPDVSEIMAYFGWNVSYILLLITAIYMREEGARKFIHPLMFLPIPLNTVQFLIYIQFGGIFNNVWQVSFSTAVAVICLQSVLYYLKNKKNGAKVPYFHILAVLYVLCEYVTWTSSCYIWIDSITNPYYLFAVFSYVAEVFFAWSIKKTYVSAGLVYPEKNAKEIRFQAILQIIVCVVLAIGCIGGYTLASWMKASLPAGTENADVFNIIAIMLFLISIFVVIIILGIVFIVT